MAKMTKAQKAAAARRRNRFKGINVTDAALGYAGVAIWSEAILGVNPIQFFTRQPASGNSFKLNMYEIMDSVMGGTGGVYGPTATSAGIQQNAFAVMERNARNNGVDAIVKSIGLGIAGTVGKKVTRKPRSFLNKTIKQFGLGEWVRF